MHDTLISGLFLKSSYIKVDSMEDISYYFDTETKDFVRFEFTGEEYWVDIITPVKDKVDYDILLNCYMSKVKEYL